MFIISINPDRNVAVNFAVKRREERKSWKQTLDSSVSMHGYKVYIHNLSLSAPSTERRPASRRRYSNPSWDMDGVGV
jgi:hypothetical protein